MPIIAKCSCGNRIGVGDAMMGKTLRCPRCGGDVLVGGAAPVAAGKGAKSTKGAAAPARRGTGSSGVVSSSFSVNPAYIAVAIVLVLLVGGGLSLYYGPWRVSTDWAAMVPQANDDITDVVQFGIQAYLQQQGTFDSGSSHMVPHVDGPVMFINPVLDFTMPAKIVFHGKTNQGNFAGTYEPRTGEIVADVEISGYSFGGLVDIRKASAKFHMTGREKNHKITAESGGAPLVLLPPTPPTPP